MHKSPKIYLIHAADVAIPPIVASFRANWPQARVVNLLEDALMSDLAEDGRLTDAMIERFVHIGHYCVKASADAILFTCSAFGPAVEECRRQVLIPVLKPNEALYEQLVAQKRHCQPARDIPAVIALDGGRDRGVRESTRHHGHG